jgi:glycosyltransferase involved in cell wall biosynthesis
MRVVMFSINPLFPRHVMGGAPKHLQNIALHLGRLGHEVTVLCTRPRDGDETPFEWAAGVHVLPVLRFKQPFPQPYEVPAYDIAAAVQTVADHLAQADRFYMHDGEFLFPYVYQHLPTVVSLRDNVYPETILGGFLFQGDALILISEYSRQYYLHTAGRFLPGLAERMHVIYNGLDWDRFKPTPPARILDLIPVDPATQAVILHPHRPEESKGIRQTVAVVDELVHRYNLRHIRTLVPRWVGAEPEAFYQDIQREIAQRGLGEYFIFHDWVPQELMPEYYSLGRVMLSLGSFPEAFGNAVYESLGCGTPVVVARVSTHREILPDELVDKVDYGDIETAAALAADVIRTGRRTLPQTLDYLHTRYSIQAQLDGYARLILEAEHKGPLAYRYMPLSDQTRFRLAPWCYIGGRGIYHDFRADYSTDGLLLALLKGCREGFTFAEAEAHGALSDRVRQWYREGYVVPA